MNATKRIVLLALVCGLALLAAVPGAPARAQSGITPLRVNVAVTGELTAAEPIAVYSFDAYESLRMEFVFDVIAGDMQPTIIVLGQDQQTLLGGTTGPNAQGLIVEFPAQGTYYVGLSAEGGTSATYRLMINASPILPINPFVLQSYMVAGTATTCAENVPATGFSTAEDLNVCFALDLMDAPLHLTTEWWSPSGEIILTEEGNFESSQNATLYLTGIIYQNEPWETGWWQVHFVIDGELAHIQWVPVF